MSDPRWVWIQESVVPAIHDMQLAEHGGPAGLRDAGLQASALERPRQLASYASPDLADLAAAYAFAIARNHPFVDGNKRTAFVCIELFLQLNGHALTAGDTDCVTHMLELAAGRLQEPALAEWIRNNMEPV